MCDHPNREAAMVVVQRDEAGAPTIWCDPCLAPLVKALNKAGMPTVASCCGHGRIPPRIALNDGRDLIIVGGICEACGGQGSYYGCDVCSDTGQTPARSANYGEAD